MYLGVAGPQTSTSTIQLKPTAQLGGRGVQTRQATAAKKAAAAKKGRGRGRGRGRGKGKGKSTKKKKPKKKKKGGKSKKGKKGKRGKRGKKGKKSKKNKRSKKLGLYFKKSSVAYYPSAGKTKRATLLSLIRKLPAAVVVRYLKKV